MVSKATLDSYEMTIGIECHVQLKTKTKLFAGVDNDARAAEPNMLVSPICFGMPGVLPVLNGDVIDLAVRAGIALNAKIAHFSKFDRKHYFYPDLPKGYQITQFDEPTVGLGSIEVPIDGESITVGITRAHIEEDAGKSTHPAGKAYSLVDLNRAGTPLLEIVSEPDIHTPQQARAYAQELFLLMKYADVSDVDLFHGNMRFDVNLSVAKKGSKELGTRSETKNLNSFKSVEKAAEFEFKRQVELLENGESVVQETRGWDDVKLQTFSQRSKEDAHDYRYFPDPDLPPVIIEQSHIDQIKKTMPLLPSAIRSQLSAAGLDMQQITTVLHNETYVSIVLTALEENVNGKKLQRLANWLTIDIQGMSSEEEHHELHVTFSQLSELADMVDANELGSSAAKDVLIAMAKQGGSPHDLAQSMNVLQVSDESAVEAIVDNVIADNPQAAQDVRDGEMKAIGFLVGQIMKASSGQANPKIAQELLRKKLQ